MSKSHPPLLLADPEQAARIPAAPPLWYGITALSFLGASADPILTLVTLQEIFNIGGFGSWLVLGAIFAASVASAMKIGNQSAKGEPRTVAVALWVAMGLGMFLLRWLEEPLIGGGDFSEFSPASQLPMALLMLLLYYITGQGIIWSAKTRTASAWGAIRPSLLQEKTAAFFGRRALARRNRAVHAVETNAAELELWSLRARDTLTVIRNDENALKDLVRLRLSAHLASPAETILELPDPTRSRAWEPGDANPIKNTEGE